MTNNENERQELDAHTPVTLINYFANAFKLDSKRSLFFLKGIYQDKKRGSYSGYFYDRVQDELSGQIVTIRVPEAIKSHLTHEQVYLFKGILDKTIRPDGVIEPVFVVAELIADLAPRVSNASEQRLAIQRQKSNEGYKDLDIVLQRKLRVRQKPRLILVYGATSIVMDDVYTALGSARQRYDIVERRTNMLDKDAIIRTIQLNGATKATDALAFVRGGGAGLQTFDHLDIARSALELPIPLITAIGHAQDVTLLEQVADKSFTTPTALGNYLKATVQALAQQPSSPAPSPVSRPYRSAPAPHQTDEIAKLLAEYKQQASRQQWVIIGLCIIFSVVILWLILGG